MAPLGDLGKFKAHSFFAHGNWGFSTPKHCRKIGGATPLAGLPERLRGSCRLTSRRRGLESDQSRLRAHRHPFPQSQRELL